MPTVSIYLNKENYLKWLKLNEPSRWVASQLEKPIIENIKENPDGTISPKDPKTPAKFEQDVIKTPEQAAERVKEVFPEAKPIKPITYQNKSNWGA